MPEIYVRLFTNNEQLIALTCKMMPIYFLGITIFGIQSTCQSTFLALGEARVSLFIALLRKVILLFRWQLFCRDLWELSEYTGQSRLRT